MGHFLFHHSFEDLFYSDPAIIRNLFHKRYSIAYLPVFAVDPMLRISLSRM
jgi:hypothetical protein